MAYKPKLAEKDARFRVVWPYKAWNDSLPKKGIFRFMGWCVVEGGKLAKLVKVGNTDIWLQVGVEVLRPVNDAARAVLAEELLRRA